LQAAEQRSKRDKTLGASAADKSRCNYIADEVNKCAWTRFLRGRM